MTLSRIGLPRPLLALAVALAAGPAGFADDEPQAPGYAISMFSSGGQNSRTLSFDAGGACFLGREGNGVPVAIYRVSADGSTIESFGPVLHDPTVAIVDLDGVVADTPGSALAIGACGDGSGCVWVIRPDGTSYEGIHDDLFNNGTALTWDNDGRLLWVDGGNFQVLASTGPNDVDVLIDGFSSTPRGITVGDDDMIYVATHDGVVQRFELDGTLAENNPVATGLPVHTNALRFGGEPWGNDLYTVTWSNQDDIHRVDVNTGEVTVIGTGFNASALEFGPDGAMYVTNRPNPVTAPTEILRLVPCPGNLNGDGEVNVLDLLVVLAGWGGPDGDVTGDGTTNVQDLLAVLGAFGPCE